MQTYNNLQLSAYSSPIHRRRRRPVRSSKENYHRYILCSALFLSLSLLFVKEKRCRRWNWGRANNLFSIILLNSPVCLWMWNLKFICLFSPLVLCCSISHFRLCDVSSKWIWEWVELSSHSWSLKLETLLKSARFHPSHIHTHHIPSPTIHSFFHWTITTGQAENHVPIWS